MPAVWVLVMMGLTASARPQFNIVDFGAVEGGQQVVTAALQAAVRAASAAGEPVEVLVPAGRFLAGSFSLASSVYLRLEAGAVLLASAALEDYPEEGWDWDPALVDTSNASGTGIVGQGRIDGQALPFWVDHYDPAHGYVPIKWLGIYGCTGGECRPKLVRFTDCNDITVAGVTLENSPDWTSLYRRCDNVNIVGVRLLGDHQFPNNDGIDIESGSNISITDVEIDVGDDGVVFSSGNTNPLRRPWWPLPAAPVSNLTMRGARIRSKSSAIKFSAIHFGNMSQHNDMHSMVFEDIEIWGSSRGIGFQQRTGGGNMYNLTFRNISIETIYPTGMNWWGSGEPIWITSVSQSSSPDEFLTGTVRDVLFKDVSMTSENGLLLSGSSAGAMDRIVFDNASLTIAILGNTTCAKGVPDVAPTGCRDYRPFSPSAKAVALHKTPAIYLEGSGSAVLRDFSVAFRGPQGPDPESPRHWPEWWVPIAEGGVCQRAARSIWDVVAEGATDFRCVAEEASLAV